MNEVTYTFSRALHMMRYSGAKMTPVRLINTGVYFIVANDEIMCYEPHGGFINIDYILCDDIMGSWVEVK